MLIPKRCPHCGERLERVTRYRNHLERTETLEWLGNHFQSFNDDIEDTPETAVEYTCPECGKTVEATYEEDLMENLPGLTVKNCPTCGHPMHVVEERLDNIQYHRVLTLNPDSGRYEESWHQPVVPADAQPAYYCPQCREKLPISSPKEALQYDAQA
jgi:predicted RNA-binding Zn-ribbon protein involved in translation (DUF1610 family)